MITSGGEFSKSNSSDEGESNCKSNRTEHSVVKVGGTIELQEATLYASDSEVKKYIGLHAVPASAHFQPEVSDRTKPSRAGCSLLCKICSHGQKLFLDIWYALPKYVPCRISW